MIRFYNCYNQILSAFVIALFMSLDISLFRLLDNMDNMNLSLSLYRLQFHNLFHYIYVNIFGSLPCHWSAFPTSNSTISSSRKNKSFNAPSPEPLVTISVLILLALLRQIVVDTSNRQSANLIQLVKFRIDLEKVMFEI